MTAQNFLLPILGDQDRKLLSQGNKLGRWQIDLQRELVLCLKKKF
jgi:hypothetical protein